MQEITNGEAVRRVVGAARCRGERIGLIPTMGALHAGHLALVVAARAQCDLVVMSIFVNPTQFGPREDFARYPRDLDRDRHLAADAGVDILFVPTAETMYPDGPEGQVIWVEPGEMAAGLCGASRPGHFRGVATVVAKLINLVQPDRAYFGQKDAQQAAIVTRMAHDLAFPVEVVVVPTVRASDGLALSSRNVYLTRAQRQQSSALWHALREAQRLVAAGERGVPAIEQRLCEQIAREAPGACLDYVAVVDAETLQPIQGPLERPALAALAVYFGTTRLIDNLLLQVPEQGTESDANHHT